MLPKRASQRLFCAAADFSDHGAASGRTARRRHIGSAHVQKQSRRLCQRLCSLISRGGYHSGQAALSHSLTGNGKKRQSRGFIVGNRKPVLCIPPQVPISSALPGSWAIMFLYCFIIFHRHFLNWCKIRCKLTYPDLPLKINKAGHFSFLRSFIVNIHCCRDIRMPHDFLNNLEIFLVLAKTSAKCMP